MTYKEALAEILGKDSSALSAKWIGGIYKCPEDAFPGASLGCCAGYSGDEMCRACWNREYQGEEFNPDYWDGD